MELRTFFYPDQYLYAFPNWNDPRIIVDVSNHRGIHQSFGMLKASRILGYLRKYFYLCISVLRVARGQFGIGDTTLIKFFDEYFPSCHISAILIGNKGKTASITMQVSDRENVILGYIKFGQNQEEILPIKNEELILRNLPTGVGPKLMYSGEFIAGYCVIVSPLQNTFVWKKNEKLAIRNYLTKLNKKKTHNFFEHPWIVWLSSRSGENFCWASILNKYKWEEVYFHGDFTPWNMTWSNSTEITMIDWERGFLEGFPYVDFIYYFIQQRILVLREKPLNILESVYTDVNEDLQQFSKEEIHCLIKIACIYGYTVRRAEIMETKVDEKLQLWNYLVNSINL